MKTMNQVDTRQIDVSAGWDVYDAQDAKIGSINDLQHDCLVVSKGTFFPKDVYVPTSAITRIDRNDHRVYLNVRKDDIKSLGWDDPNTVDTTSPDPAYDTRTSGTGFDPGFDTTQGGEFDTTREPAGTGSMRTQRTGYGDEEDLSR